jgi:hypothetical protein
MGYKIRDKAEERGSPKIGSHKGEPFVAAVQGVSPLEYSPATQNWGQVRMAQILRSGTMKVGELFLSITGAV